MSIPKSIKTRLLSASYTAACVVAERVFDLTERLRVQEEDSYQDDLFNYRDELADELAEGKAQVEVLTAHNAKVQFELDFVEREINGPTYTEREQVPEGAGVRDFDDLPQGSIEIDMDPIKYFDEDDAPEGYKAAPYDREEHGCHACYFYTETDCPLRGDLLHCDPRNREDRTEVHFVKR